MSRDRRNAYRCGAALPRFSHGPTNSASMLALALCLTLAPVLQAQTYPGPPVLTVVGSLNCGARLYSAGQVQTYCFYQAPGSPPGPTVCNSLDLIYPPMPVNPPTTQLVSIAAARSCFAHDATGITEITWLISQTNWQGAIKYQIAQQFYPALTVPPPTTNQSGTF